VGQAVCKDFLKLINGSLDVESLAEARQALGDVLEDESLSADQKLKTLVNKYSELNEESEMLRIRIKELEKSGGSGGGSGGSGGGGGELTPEMKKILENAESTNQKLSQIMLELTTVKEAKEALELKLKEVGPVAVLHLCSCVLSRAAYTDAPPHRSPLTAGLGRHCRGRCSPPAPAGHGCPAPTWYATFHLFIFIFFFLPRSTLSLPP
jgi:hypothetical protein